MIDDIITLKFNKNGDPLYPIRSFVRRNRHLTKRQQKLIDDLLPIIGIKYQSTLVNLEKIFGCEAPVVLEIGFGKCSSLVETAIANPKRNFLGIEVHEPSIGACLSAVKKAGIKNLRVICHDAVEVLENMILDNSLIMVQLFFPDPWHKSRHNKRRIVQVDFAKLVLCKLQVGGIFHMATDWKSYAEQMLKVMNSIYGYKNKSDTNEYVPRPCSRPLTKFEKRGQRLGHNIWDLMFEKIKY